MLLVFLPQDHVEGPIPHIKRISDISHAEKMHTPNLCVYVTAKKQNSFNLRMPSRKNGTSDGQ